jgi:hypothetical protein
VERALEGDHRRPLRVQPRELDGVLDRFGARVEERRLGRAAERRALDQPLGELDVGLVRDYGEVGVREARDLLRRGLDDPRMAVADVQTADAAGEVDEDVAVDVRDRCASCATTGRAIVFAFATTRRLRSRISAERGPGIAVRMSIVLVVATGPD